MPHLRQVLFIQGGGFAVHDEWDAKLVHGVQRELGDDCTIRYPRMPQEDDPDLGSWSATIAHELATAADGVVVVGHSVGGTILVAHLAQSPPQRRLAAIVLLAAPFVGAGGWPSDELQLPNDLGARLPQDVPVHVVQGLADETTPPAHADFYLRAVPRASQHLLPGVDHQFGDHLPEVARVIGSAFS